MMPRSHKGLVTNRSAPGRLATQLQRAFILRWKRPWRTRRRRRSFCKRPAYIANKLRRLRNYRSAAKYQHDIVGHNSRLDELQAAFLRVKLAALDGWNEKRRSVARHYLSGVDVLRLIFPAVPNWAGPVWHLFAVHSSTRDALQAHLSALGIGTGIHYPIPPHLQACYAPWDKELPIAETLAREVVSLPMSPQQTEEETEYVVDAVKKYQMQSVPHARYLTTA